MLSLSLSIRFGRCHIITASTRDCATKIIEHVSQFRRLRKFDGAWNWYVCRILFSTDIKHTLCHSLRSIWSRQTICEIYDFNLNFITNSQDIPKKNTLMNLEREKYALWIDVEQERNWRLSNRLNPFSDIYASQIYNGWHEGMKASGQKQSKFLLRAKTGQNHQWRLLALCVNNT